jgi:hypothetical protein
MTTFKEWLKLPTFRARPQLTFPVANYVEFAGASMLTTGVYLLAGLGWALVAGALILIVASELVLGDNLSVTLPRPPHPIRRLRRAHP